MQAMNIERVSALFAARRSRRSALRSGAAGIAAVALGAVALDRASAQQATPEAGATPSLLFVQAFGAGELAPKAGADGVFTLTLSQGSGATLYFSDRPDRFVGTITTAEFLEELAGLSDDPPNAALVAEGADGEQVLVVELLGATIDEAAGTITYDVQILAETDAGMQFEQEPVVPTEPMTFGLSHLFIDDVQLAGCSPWDPRC